MGINTSFISNKNSKEVINESPKLPLATDLADGEIAVNFAKDYETLAIKNESGDVVTFSSDNKFYKKSETSGATEIQTALGNKLYYNSTKCICNTISQRRFKFSSFNY